MIIEELSELGKGYKYNNHIIYLLNFDILSKTNTTIDKCQVKYKIGLAWANWHLWSY